MGKIFDRKTLVMPDSTIFEEKTISSNADIIVSDRAIVEYGLITNKRVFVGEKVRITGDLAAEDDIRIDMWSEIEGDIAGSKDISLGEKVRVLGKVSVGRDFDVGGDVTLEKGFEAKGWINIRNPLPLIIYVFMYVLELLKQGKSKEVEAILNELDTSTVEEEFLVSDIFLFVPEGSVIAPQDVRVKGNCWVGDNCKIVGNHFVAGDIKIGKNTTVYGAVRCGGDVKLGCNSVIQGDVECDGTLMLEDNGQILGDVVSSKVNLARNTIINGVIRAEDGVRFRTETSKLMTEKLERYNRGLDELDALI